MDSNVFDGTLRAFKKLIPFKPFTITLVNGEQFEVDFPDAYNHRDGVGVYLKPGGIPVIFDHEGVAQITGDLMHREEAA